MKRFLFALFIFTSINAHSQTDTAKVKKESPWKLNGTTSLNFVQSSYNNWSAGGNNTVAGASAGMINIKYNKNKASWVNILDMGYGLTFQGSNKSKNDDKIYFESKFNYKAFEEWNYTAYSSFRSQFDKGYPAYPITDKSKFNSKFMSPANMMLSIGMDYIPKLEPTQTMSYMISPFSGRITVVAHDSLANAGNLGVKNGKNSNYEFGAYTKFNYTKKFKQNISIRTSIDLFSNLLKNPGNVVVNCDFAMDMKVNKYISSKLGTQMIYDDKIKTPDGGAKLQFKQLLGIGFSYIF